MRGQSRNTWSDAPTVTVTCFLSRWNFSLPTLSSLHQRRAAMFVHKVAVRSSRTGTRGLASALLSRSETDWLAKTANDLRKEAKARGLSQFVLFLCEIVLLCLYAFFLRS